MHFTTATWIIMTLFVIVLVVIALFFLPIRIEVTLSQDNADTDGQVKVSTLFGLVRWQQRLVEVKVGLTREGPAVQTTQAGQKKRERSILTAREVMHILRNWQTWAALFRQVNARMRELMRHVHVEHLTAEATVGTGNVVSTGIACGAMWAVLGGLVGAFTRAAQFQEKPQLNVQPDFDSATFRLTARCIARVRAGYAMITAMRLFGVWRRRTSDGTPNPGSYENSHGEHSRNGRREHNYRRSG